MAEDNPPAHEFGSAGALHEGKRGFDAILNNTKMAVFMMDERQQCVFMNKAAEDLTGYAFEETRGRPLHDIIHHKRPDGSHYPLEECPIDRAFPEENQVEGEELFVHKDGHFYPVAFTASPIRDADGCPVGTVIEARNIEEERRRDQALRDSEAHLSAILGQTAAGVAEVDLDGRFVSVNDRYCAIVGRTREELLAMRMQDLTHPDDLPGNLQLFGKAIETGEGFSIEKRYLRPDGSDVWVYNTVNLIRAPDGSPASVLAVSIDISEQRQAQDQLQASAQRFRAVFENAGVGMVEIDSEWRVQGANRVYREITGYSADELVGESCLAFTDPDDIAKSKEAMRAVAAGETPGISFEKRYIRKDGGIVWIRSNVASLGGHQSRFLKIVEDINDRKAAETALREESHTLETLNRTGAALAGELDLERVVQMVTDAGVDLTGAQFGAFFYNVLDQAGESYMLFALSGADRAQFERFGMPRNTHVFSPTFNAEGIVRSDDITKDPRYGQNPPHHGMPKGHLPVVSYLAVPVVSRTGEVIGGLFFGHPAAGRFSERHERLMEGIAAQAAISIDNARLFRAAQHEIEQRNKAEQALTALNETLESRVADEIGRRSHAEEALRQAQKMETVGQLSGGIAHDFNNLLQIIHGNLTIMQRAVAADDAKLHRTIANALSGTERAAALTQRLLAFSRRQPLDPKPVDVNRMILDMTDLLRRTLGEPIQVETNLARDLCYAHVDANQLENAILNLAINSRDAMPEGGMLTIETEPAEVDAAYAQLHPDADPGAYVRITVSDTGIGMAPEVLQRAVEPFFTTKEVGQGTGLGLSMVYGFLKQSGGHLDLRSEEGAGTSVDIFLPCSTAAAEKPVSNANEGDLPQGKGERILVCEDDEDVRRFSTDILAELGYDVHEAHDADSALALLEREGPVDLLFTDVVLPGGKTGADLARAARERQPDLKVLFTTGYARTALDNTELSRALELISKPFSVDDLARRLRQMLDQPKSP